MNFDNNLVKPKHPPSKYLVCLFVCLRYKIRYKRVFRILVVLKWSKCKHLSIIKQQNQEVDIVGIFMLAEPNDLCMCPKLLRRLRQENHKFCLGFRKIQDQLGQLHVTLSQEQTYKKGCQCSSVIGHLPSQLSI